MTPLLGLPSAAYLRPGFRSLLCVLLAVALGACASIRAHRIKANTYEVEARIAELDYQALGLRPLEMLATHNAAQVTVDVGADYFKALGGSHRGLAKLGVVGGVGYHAGPGTHFLWLRIEVVKANELPKDVAGYFDARKVLESWPDIDDVVVDMSTLPLIRPDSGLKE